MSDAETAVVAPESPPPAPADPAVATALLTGAAATWAALLAVALPGTRQGGTALPDLPALPAAADAAPGPDADPRNLLRAAGALGLLRRAGYVPAAATAAPAPAPAETRPELSAVGVAALRRMLEQNEYAQHLAEYLRRATAAGRRLPHGDLLIHALDYLSADAQAGAVAWARPVLGEHGAWLADLNPRWAKALGAAPVKAEDDDLTIWETGVWAERLTWLTDRFETDPAGARALLLAALPTEPARQQEPLLELLEYHLVPEAEAVLEPLLKARGQDVRRRAAELLARLPNAALSGRLWTRVEPLIKLKKALLGKDSLEVELPTVWDKSWLADGIEEKSDHYRWRFNLNTGRGHNATVGEAAVRLGTLLALVPVRRWLTHFKVDADELLGLGLRSKDWQQALLVGWAMSAVNTEDQEVIEAFIELYFTKHEQIKRAAAGVRWYELVRALPRERRVAVIGPPLLARVRQNSAEWPEQVGMMPAPWPRELTLAVLSAALAKAALSTASVNLSNELNRFRYHSVMGLAATIADEDLAPAIAALDPAKLPPMHEAYLHALTAVYRELVFRQTLVDSLV